MKIPWIAALLIAVSASPVAADTLFPVKSPFECMFAAKASRADDHTRRGECQKPGALRRELDCWVAKLPVQHRRPDLKHTMGAAG